jgi:hypothetical protein
MGRANVDEELYNDPRFRRLCRLMAWPHPDFVVGALTRLWIFAGNRVDADNPRGLVPLEDADDATDHRGFIEACIQSGMAQDEDGLLYFCGMEERSKNLAQRAPSKGGKARAATAIRDERGRMLPSGSKPVTSKLVQRDSSVLDSDSSKLDQHIQPSAPLRSAQLSSAESDPRPLELDLTEPDVPALPPMHAEAKRLWMLQEELRARTIPKARPLKPTEERIARVLERLEENTPADCQHVLEVYAADAQRRPTSREWFNGETNWRKANFDRALGRTVEAQILKPSFGPQPAAPMESEAERMVRAFERDARRFGLVDAEGNPT